MYCQSSQKHPSIRPSLKNSASHLRSPCTAKPVPVLGDVLLHTSQLSLDILCRSVHQHHHQNHHHHSRPISATITSEPGLKCGRSSGVVGYEVVGVVLAVMLVGGGGRSEVVAVVLAVVLVGLKW